MIVMVTMTYPTTSAVEMGKAGAKNFQEHPLPGFMKLTGPYITICEEGCKAYNIIEIEEGKEDEAFKVINTRMANYLPVPGFRSREERLLIMGEAYPLIGMKAPQV